MKHVGILAIAMLVLASMPAQATPPGTTVVTSSVGGSGLANPTAHSVLLGEGSGPFGTAAIGTSGRALLDQG
jgi:hypothetical protein